MKDGTELTHYGVKGMKWGKHIFGKVKGVFGKKTEEKEMFPHARMKEQLNREKAIANKSTNRTGMGMALTAPGGINKRSDSENKRLATQWDADNLNKYYKSDTGWDRQIKKQNSTKKRYSTRLNGR